MSRCKIYILFPRYIRKLFEDIIYFTDKNTRRLNICKAEGVEGHGAQGEKHGAKEEGQNIYYTYSSACLSRNIYNSLVIYYPSVTSKTIIVTVLTMCRSGRLIGLLFFIKKFLQVIFFLL